MRQNFRFLARSSHTLLTQALHSWPVVVVTGPSQAGKSTLLKTALSGWPMVSLQDLDLRAFAEQASGLLK